MVTTAKNLLVIPKSLLQMHSKHFQKEQFKKKTEATSDLIGNTIANKTRKVSRSSQQNNSKTIRNEHNKEIPKERYMSAEQRQKIIDDSSLI